jgi:hypothetical protein
MAQRLISLLQTLEWYAESDFQEDTKQKAYQEVAQSLASIDPAELQGYLASLNESARLRCANLIHTKKADTAEAQA